MGAWGTGLYEHDTAVDLRNAFKRVVRAPWDGDRLVAWALDQHPAGNDPTDEYGGGTPAGLGRRPPPTPASAAAPAG